VLLTILCAETDADKFSEMILRETSAFGVRRTVAERRKLRREFTKIKTPFGDVTVKIGRSTESWFKPRRSLNRAKNWRRGQKCR